jgi:hypothetical protein
MNSYQAPEDYLKNKLDYSRQQSDTQDSKIREIIEELESRKDYGTEYAQAMEDVIVILKAKFGIDQE